MKTPTPCKLLARAALALAGLLLLPACELGSTEEANYTLDGIQTYEAPPPAAPAPSSSSSTTTKTASPAPPPAPSEIPSGIGVPGRRGGFLWKPISESDGKLVILLPSSYTGNVSMCYITDSNGNFIETGRFAGVHNGGRNHYRFSKPGAQYGNNLYAIAVNSDGSLHHWFVPNGASRNEQ